MIEQVKPTEYDTILNECRIKIGGTVDKFVPNINASKWNDEAWVNINCPVPVEFEKEAFADGKIEIGIRDEKHRFYEVDGKLEYEIEYTTRLADKIEFDLTFSEGLTFYKQKTLYEEWQNEQAENLGNPNNLTWEQYQQAAHRPDNVINSYAVYHSKRNNKYETGKFCHIYRVNLIDADGKSTWADDMEVIPVDKTHVRLVVIMPAKWLDKAKYPIRVDPTLGYDSGGGSNWGYNNIRDTIWDVTDASGGAINTYYCRLESVVANTDCKMGVFNCNQGTYTPDAAALVEQVLLENVSVGVNSVAGGSTVLAASTYYNIAWIPEDSGNDVYYDSNGNVGYYRSGITYANDLAATWENGATVHTRHYSLWVDYGGGGGTAHELAGTIVNVAALSGNVVRNRLTIGSFASVAAPVGTLIRNRILTGSLAGASAFSGGVNRLRIMIGSLAGSSGLTGLINRSRVLIGNLAGASSLAGTTVLNKIISGSLAAVSALSARLNLLKIIKGSFAAAGSFVGALTTAGQITLQGVIAAGSAFTANVNLLKIIKGSFAAASGLSGRVSLLKIIKGSFAAAGSFIGALNVAGQVLLQGVIAAGSAFTAKVNIRKTFAGAISAGSTLVGALTRAGSISLQGIISASSSLSSTVNLRKTFAGVINAITAIAGTIRKWRMTREVQELTSKGHLSEELTSSGALSQELTSKGELSQELTSKGCLSEELTSAGHLSEELLSVMGDAS